MRTYRVIVNDSFVENVNNIVNYIIDEYQSVEGAEKILTMLDEALISLRSFPLRCGLSNDDVLRGRGLRVLHVKSYDILFDVHEEEGVVRVHYIKHCRQDVSNMEF